MASELGRLRFDSGTMVGVHRAGALSLSIEPNELANDPVRFWQSMATMLQWANRNTQKVCVVAKEFWPNNGDTNRLRAEGHSAARCVPFWRMLARIASEQTVQDVHEAAKLVTNNSSEDVAHHAEAIKQHGTANAFESPNGICALFTEAFSGFFEKLAKLGSQDELDVAKAAMVLGTAGLWNKIPFICQ
jgi:hypothetical protein